jgi:hypothetical protein
MRPQRPVRKFGAKTRRRGSTSVEHRHVRVILSGGRRSRRISARDLARCLGWVVGIHGRTLTRASKAPCGRVPVARPCQGEARGRTRGGSRAGMITNTRRAARRDPSTPAAFAQDDGRREARRGKRNARKIARRDSSLRGLRSRMTQRADSALE